MCIFREQSKNKNTLNIIEVLYFFIYNEYLNHYYLTKDSIGC